MDAEEGGGDDSDEEEAADEKADAGAAARSAKGYQGATVIEPKTGMYFGPICTLDFSSLYPSIIIAYNLSFETLVASPQAAAALPPDSCHEFSGGGGGGGSEAKTLFVKPEASPNGAKGLLPSILVHLLQARKRAKAAMNEAADPVERAILNGRQLALKISCNSVYGFCGAAQGYLPCLPIAATVTLIGRGLIEKTREIVGTTACERLLRRVALTWRVRARAQSVTILRPRARRQSPPWCTATPTRS